MDFYYALLLVENFLIFSFRFSSKGGRGLLWKYLGGGGWEVDVYSGTGPLLRGGVPPWGVATLGEVAKREKMVGR